MTRQDQFYKWFVYFLGLLPLWLADAYLLGRYFPMGTKPLLLLLSVVAVAVMEGATAGAGFGLGVGLLWVFGYPHVNSGMILFLVLAGMWVGIAAQYILTQGFLGCLLCSAGVLAVLECMRVAWGLFSHQAELQILLHVVCREFIFTLIWTPLVYLIFRAVFRRVGLDKLA